MRWGEGRSLCRVGRGGLNLCTCQTGHTVGGVDLVGRGTRMHHQETAERDQLTDRCTGLEGLLARSEQEKEESLAIEQCRENYGSVSGFMNEPNVGMTANCQICARINKMEEDDKKRLAFRWEGCICCKKNKVLDFNDMLKIHGEI